MVPGPDADLRKGPRRAQAGLSTPKSFLLNATMGMRENLTPLTASQRLSPLVHQTEVTEVTCSLCP